MLFIKISENVIVALQRTRDNDEQIRNMMVTLFPYTTNILQKNCVDITKKHYCKKINNNLIAT